jgi:hypothetical protein
MKKELGTWLLNTTDIFRSLDYAIVSFSSLRIGCGVAEHVQAPQLLEADKRPTHFQGFRIPCLDQPSQTPVSHLAIPCGGVVNGRCR